MGTLNLIKRNFNKTFLTVFLLLVFAYLYITLPKIASSIDEFYNILKNLVFSHLGKVIIVLTIIIITKIFINFTLKKVENTLEKKGRKQDILLFNVPYKFFIWFIVVLVSLSILFKNFATLIASLGLIGFGITFALQKPILNFVGWVTIISKKPYWIGDRIMIGAIKGDVYDMNIMYTSLSEFSFPGDEPSGKSITVPNEYVLTQPIINYTKGSSFVWDVVEIGITYLSDWKETSRIIEESTSSVVGQSMKENAERWKLNKQKFTILGKDIVDRPLTRIEFCENFVKVRCHYLVESRKKGKIRSEIMNIILEKIKDSKNIYISVNKAYLP